MTGGQRSSRFLIHSCIATGSEEDDEDVEICKTESDGWNNCRTHVTAGKRRMDEDERQEKSRQSIEKLRRRKRMEKHKEKPAELQSSIYIRWTFHSWGPKTESPLN